MQTPDEPHYPPQNTTKKQERTKAWFFTIMLHLLIAGVIITYWYTQKRLEPIPTRLAPTSVVTESAQAKLPPLVTETASQPTANASSVMPASSPAERPLANYIKTIQQTPPNVEPSLIQQQVQQRIKRVEISPPPVNQVLTSRDIAKNEQGLPPKPLNSEQKEIAELAESLEKDHDKLSELIEQTKQRNQRQIEENLRKNNQAMPKLVKTQSEQNQQISNNEKPAETPNEKHQSADTPNHEVRQDQLQEIDVPSKADKPSNESSE